MISTRENLLCRPWQQRKYEYHKKKVLSATPVIDTKSPPHRPHVALKLKKLQKEEERSRKIERDNLMLLQKLNYIMAKHWQDNYLPPQPTFLSRIGVYRSSESGLLEALAEGQDSKIQLLENVPRPEERVPWEPPKSHPERGRSRSVPPRRRAEPLPTISEKPKSALVKPPNPEHSKWSKHPNLVLSRGALQLSFHFPADTLIQFDRRRAQNKVCRCSRQTK
ncbi:hypothetical protein HUJ04_013183 [Dendroctonus ponderosae]|nr:hypothetical protein HUJ04_013183 [Dendroctonus ponderosae]